MEFTKTLLVMKLTLLLMMSAILGAGAHGISQTVSLTGKNLPLKTVFTEIEKQTGYVVSYTDDLLAEARPVSVKARNISVQEFMQMVLAGQPIGFRIEYKTIFLFHKQASGPAPLAETAVATVPAGIDVTGRVIDRQGKPLAGASVNVRGSATGSSTDLDGRFQLKGIDGNAILEITFVGFQRQAVPVNGRTSITVMLLPSYNELDDVRIIGYGTTTQRTTTGSSTRVSAAEIEKQPATNVLSALQGRTPGVFVSAPNGLPGANITVQIRGRNSIAAGNDPLYVIDGVPFPSAPINNGILLAANGYDSPLNSMNPNDIESIEILKDADATAIYGSRAANGVVLITTKKNHSQLPKTDVNAYTGWGRPTHLLATLGTADYLRLRREAFQNDNVTPTTSNAPDLLVWDTTAHIDFMKQLAGNTARIYDAQSSYSVGDDRLSILLGGSYHRETTVYGNGYSFTRKSGYFNLSNTSRNKKFALQLTSNYVLANNNLTPVTLERYFYNLPPNYPEYDAQGRYYWGAGKNNPIAFSKWKNNAQTANFINSLNIKYRVLPRVTASVNLGYNRMDFDQVSPRPRALQNPANNPLGSTGFENTHTKTWIAEPQLNYQPLSGAHKLEMLAGATFQQTVTTDLWILASNYTNDALLEGLGAAGTLRINLDDELVYKYNSVFGRLSYSYKGKYLANANFRRDGSSRFGPQKRFGNFGDLALGWVFTEENFLKNAHSFLSFGKIRASYGITGNDQIQDYRFLSLWSSTTSTMYQTPGISANRIGNDEYSWEQNKKLDMGLDLGLLNSRITVIADYFNNISDNELVGYSLPTQTGFTSYQANLPARVRNTGWELGVSARIIQSKDLSWNSGLNFTQYSNKLVSFPGIENSSYSSTYQVGQSLNVIKGYQYAGLDAATGIPKFLDIDKDSKISYPNDYIAVGKKDPVYYGGWNNDLTYKNFQLSFLFQFVKQQGSVSDVYSIAGSLANLPQDVLNHWTKPGDNAMYPKVTATSGTTAYSQYSNLINSSFFVRDASYIRFKTLSLSYQIEGKLKQAMKFSSCKVFAQAANLWTITGYDGFDPETGGTNTPPLRVFSVGFNINF